MPASLISTLGTEPQVVTLALELLRRRSILIGEVIVIHTDGNALPACDALARLRPAMAALRPTVAYREVEIRCHNQPVADIETEDEARATFETIYRAALAVKKRSRPLHICMAGGRKTMAVYGMLTAQLLSEPGDGLWHLVSYGTLLQEKRMHLQSGDRVTLVPIPIVHWSSVPPSLTEIGSLPTPEQALTAINRRQTRALQQQVETFIQSTLTKRERAIVETAVANHTWTYKEIAEHHGCSPKTIDTHMQSAYRKLEVAFALDKANRAALVKILTPYRPKTQEVS